jgi:hypothetical protein
MVVSHTSGNAMPLAVAAWKSATRERPARAARSAMRIQHAAYATPAKTPPSFGMTPDSVSARRTYAPAKMRMDVPAREKREASLSS